MKQRKDANGRRSIIISDDDDPWSPFLYGMKAPMTREKYSGRVAKFFDFIGFTEDTMEERKIRMNLNENASYVSQQIVSKRGRRS